jgi:hypothetical protein
VFRGPRLGRSLALPKRQKLELSLTMRGKAGAFAYEALDNLIFSF